MHDVMLETSSSLATVMTQQPPRRKSGVNHIRRVSTAELMVQNRKISGSNNINSADGSTSSRPRSKTFSNTPKPKRKTTLERRMGAWAERCFVAQFPPPSRRLTDDCVISLKSYHVTRWSLTGGILVKNTSFHKRVYVRYTLDGWKTSEDIQATFQATDHVNHEDVFQFRLDFPFRLPHGTRLELAMAYETPDGTVYWDNNDGENYVFVYSFLP